MRNVVARSAAAVDGRVVHRVVHRREGEHERAHEQERHPERPHRRPEAGPVEDAAVARAEAVQRAAVQHGGDRCVQSGVPAQLGQLGERPDAGRDERQRRERLRPDDGRDRTREQRDREERQWPVRVDVVHLADEEDLRREREAAQEVERLADVGMRPPQLAEDVPEEEDDARRARHPVPVGGHEEHDPEACDDRADGRDHPHDPAAGRGGRVAQIPAADGGGLLRGDQSVGRPGVQLVLELAQLHDPHHSVFAIEGNPGCTLVAWVRSPSSSRRWRSSASCTAAELCACRAAGRRSPWRGG